MRFWKRALWFVGILACLLIGASFLEVEGVDNPITRFALRTMDWVMTGAWSFSGTVTHTGALVPPTYATASLPNPCVLNATCIDSTTGQHKRCITASPAEWEVIAGSAYLESPTGSRMTMTLNDDLTVTMTNVATGQTSMIYPFPLADDPALPLPGALWYNYTTGQYGVHDGTGITRICTEDDPC